MVFPVILAFVPLLGVASVAAIEAIKKGQPTEGSVFRIASQGDQVWIIINGERRPIHTDALEELGFNVNSDAIRAINEDKLEGIPIGMPVTIQLVHAMRL